MGFFRREEPLHEKLAREGGLDFPRNVRELTLQGPLDPQHPFWRVAGIHGIPRVREWDAVASAEAPGLPGDEVSFVALEDGTLIVDEDVPEDSLAPLAEALEISIQAPYHAVAIRQGDDVWGVAALRVEVVEVPEEVAGDEVAIVLNDGERSVLVDEAESRESVAALEDYAASRFDSFVLHASRLDDRLWEVTVLPL
jgi:hypothetical protein